MKNTIPEIKTEEEYEKALERILDLFDADPLSDEERELEILCIAVEDYGKIHYPIL